MKLFPFFTNIEDKTFLIIGGGKVAKRKVERLLNITDNIIVIAKETGIEGQRAEYDSVREKQGVRILIKAYEETDLSLGDYCIGATDSPSLNRKIYEHCRKRGIPVNITDDQALCTFTFPGIIKRGDLLIAISTGGSSPAASKCLREMVEEALPPGIEDIIERLGALRGRLYKEIPAQGERSLIYRRLFHSLIESENTLSDEEIEDIIDGSTKDA